MNARALRLLLVAVLLLPVSVAAQKQFTLEDLNFGGTNYRNMIPQNRTLKWWGDVLVHVDDTVCTAVDVKTAQEKPLMTLSQVNAWLDAGEMGKLKTLGKVTFPYGDKPLALLKVGKRRVLVDFKEHAVEWSQDASEEGATADWCSKSRAVAYVKDDNLYVQYPDREVVRLSTDGSRNIVYGQSVHRNEFGIDGGLFWNPDGTKLAFYRMDQSMVDDYPLVDVPEIKDPASVMATPAPEKYPMAGLTSHKVTVGVFDMASRKIVYLKAGDPTDRYFTNVSWSAAGDVVYMFELNRDQNDMRLVSYNATTGEKIEELYRETQDKYVEPRNKIVPLPWASSQLMFQTMKDGWNHIYLIDAKTKQIKQITSGKWEVLGVLGFNAKEHKIIYESTEDSYLQSNIYSVNVDNGKRTRLDADGKGWHKGVLSGSGKYVVDTYQEPDVPRNIDILAVKQPAAVRYFTADDPWKDYAVPQYKLGYVTAADGVTELPYRMVLPPDFDETKKYPTVVYVYGGPHAHSVDAGWHYHSRSWETYMAQKGYVLFIMDNRGGEHRGRAHEQATFRQLGQVEMQDQMKGVEFLRTLNYVDTARLGIHGWSFGGFMTISLMTNYPDVFKVGVAGGPVIDWKWYEVMYGERYMDTPATNPEGYEKTSLINKAKNLKGRLQIIIGGNDPVVLPQHAKSFLKACIAAGTQPDFYVYPGEPHNMRGHQSVHLHERITRYFDDYLK